MVAYLSNVTKNNMKKALAYILPMAMFMPFLASAQSADAQSILTTISGILNFIIPMLITFAIITFIYGVIQYVIAKEDAAKEKGRNTMIYSIVGLFAIVAVWGLVQVLVNTFLDGNTGSFQGVDCIPGSYDINGNPC
ncbi:MAG: hypothetical protein QG669_332 [Patescibacteria group bacterium]|jgi:heme A synthase|nr:hypothetical protein [Patescibacteria group bacterium]